jgi:hypothetical protein
VDFLEGDELTGLAIATFEDLRGEEASVVESKGEFLALARSDTIRTVA